MLLVLLVVPLRLRVKTVEKLPTMILLVKPLLVDARGLLCTVLDLV